MFHNFGVVNRIPLDVIVEGEIMRFYNTQLKFSNFTS